VAARTQHRRSADRAAAAKRSRGRKIGTLRDLAGRLSDGRLDPKVLRSLPDDELVAELGDRGREHGEACIAAAELQPAQDDPCASAWRPIRGSTPWR
jgi:hypothetical protein